MLALWIKHIYNYLLIIILSIWVSYSTDIFISILKKFLAIVMIILHNFIMICEIYKWMDNIGAGAELQELPEELPRPQEVHQRLLHQGVQGWHSEFSASEICYQLVFQLY